MSDDRRGQANSQFRIAVRLFGHEVGNLRAGPVLSVDDLLTVLQIYDGFEWFFQLFRGGTPKQLNREVPKRLLQEMLVLETDLLTRSQKAFHIQTLHWLEETEREGDCLIRCKIVDDDGAIDIKMV